MRVLVTGATGFVGSHVAEALVAAGHEVVVSLRGRSNPRWLAGLEVERRALDLALPDRASEALAGVEAIVHAGGITRATDETEFRRVNVEGTRSLLRAAVAAGVRRCLLISSLAARGPDGRPAELSAYGRSKLEAEQVATGFADTLEVAALRLAGVYGPRDTDLLPLFRMARRGFVLLPRREARLQPVFAADVAELVARLLSRSIGFGPWPIAEPRSYRWAEVGPLMGAALGRPVRALHAASALFLTAAAAAEGVARLRRRAPAFDRRRALDLARHAYTCDLAGTEAATGWRARVGLAEGLARTAHWYREHGWL